MEDWTKEITEEKIKVQEKNSFIKPVISTWLFTEINPNPAFIYIDNVFTKQECEQIISIGNSLFELRPAETQGAKFIDKKVRDSLVSWITVTQDTSWIYKKIQNIVMEANLNTYRFELLGLIESLQFTKYVGPTGNYSKHVDHGNGMPVRKLSLVLQLSDPKDYTGGELCLYLSSKADKITRSQGSIAIFPSYTLHEVKPVTKGIRYSLVCWVNGPSFR